MRPGSIDGERVLPAWCQQHPATHYEIVMLARALRIQQGQRDFKKQSGSGEANGRLDCFVASAFLFAR
jgi:hypothetical protein